SSQIRYLLYFVPIMNIDNRRGNLKSVPKKFGLLVLNNVKTFLTFKLSEEPLVRNLWLPMYSLTYRLAHSSLLMLLSTNL
ncbi:MAG: hypothetical protein WA941_18150, partial [Nitrososphaeraceae archaeon]